MKAYFDESHVFVNRIEQRIERRAYGQDVRRDIIRLDLGTSSEG